jgi:hypothetical protein
LVGASLAASEMVMGPRIWIDEVPFKRMVQYATIQ